MNYADGLPLIKGKPLKRGDTFFRHDGYTLVITSDTTAWYTKSPLKELERNRSGWRLSTFDMVDGLTWAGDILRPSWEDI